MAERTPMGVRGEALCFAYRPDKTVVDQVSIALKPGDFTAILGPNGSGKTTLLRLLTGVLTPNSGAITLGAKPLAQWDRRELARELAVVPQHTHIAFPFTVAEIVLMGRSPYLGSFPFETRRDVEIADAAMEATEVYHLARRGLHQCSGGERQRVLLARALAQEPTVLLLDEPAANLDIRHQVAVYELLARMNDERGLTVGVVSHDWNLPAQFCTGAVLLDQGRVSASGPLESVMSGERIRAVYQTGVEVARSPQTGKLYMIPVRGTGKRETDSGEQGP